VRAVLSDTVRAELDLPADWKAQVLLTVGYQPRAGFGKRLGRNENRMVLDAKVVALAGGVGGANLSNGLSKCLPPEQFTIIGNVADDLELFGPAYFSRFSTQ